MNTMELRPLSLGEQLDRAVTLCVKNRLLFFVIYIVFSVPLAVSQVYGSDDPSKILGIFMDAARFHKHIDQATLAAVSKPVFNAFTIVYYCLLLFVSPLAQAATIFAASEVYRASEVTFTAAYQAALRFWAPFIGINILYIFVGVGIVVLCVLIDLAGLGVGFLASLSHGAGALFAVTGGVIAFIAFFMVLLLLWVAVNVSYFTCVVERMGFFSAFARGIRFAFSRAGFQRALVAALALASISIGVVLVNAVGAVFIYGFLRSAIAGAIFTALMQAVFAIFSTVFFAVFYYDMRVRREGFDLQQEVLQAPSPLA